MSKPNEIIKSAGTSTIVAATKYVDSSKMIELLDYNITHFGENRVDSFCILCKKVFKKSNCCDIIYCRKTRENAY